MRPPSPTCAPTRFERLMAWILPLIAAITPLVVIYLLQQPQVGQAYFFSLAVLAATAAQGTAWALGWARPPRPAWLPLGLALALAASVATSLPFSNDLLFSLRQAILPLCAFLFLMLIVVSPLRRALLTRATVALLAVGALLAVYGIAQHYGFEFLRYSGQLSKNAVVATIGHPNYLSSVLGPLIFLAASLAQGQRRHAPRALALALVCLLAGCILLARTRSIWLGLGVGTAAMFLLGLRYWLRNRAARGPLGELALGAGLALGALVALMLLVAATGRPVDLVDRISSTNEIRSRLFYWKTAIAMGDQHPLLGRGFAMYDPGFWPATLEVFKSEDGPYYQDVMPSISGTTPGHAHSEYLEVYAEQGLVGLVSLLAFLGFFLWYGYLRLMREPDERAAFRQLAVWCALVLMLVDAALSFPWRLPVSLIVLMIVLGWQVEFIYGQPPAAAPAEAPEAA